MPHACLTYLQSVLQRTPKPLTPFTSYPPLTHPQVHLPASS